MIDFFVTFFFFMLNSLITSWVLSKLVEVIHEKMGLDGFFPTVLFLGSHLVALFVIMGFAVVNEASGIPMSITAFTLCGFFSLIFASLFYCSGADGYAGHKVGLKHFIIASIILNLIISLIGTKIV